MKTKINFLSVILDSIVFICKRPKTLFCNLIIYGFVFTSLWFYLVGINSQDDLLSLKSSNLQIIFTILLIIAIVAAMVFLIIYFFRLISIDTSISVWNYFNSNERKSNFRNWLRFLNSAFIRVSFFDFIFILPIYIFFRLF